jgi:hypothetical protein
MKIFRLSIFLLVITSAAFGQQFLWKTESDTAMFKAAKIVPLNKVTSEVLKFYSQYNYYCDFSGYSKERFLEKFDYGFKDWTWLNDINNLTVFALRSNPGTGSVVIVMCVSKDNVNTIIFSNYVLECGSTMSTPEYDAQKFASWFKTLLN